MPTYEEAAQSIIKEAIKSAIFIDENAKEPFMQEEPAESKRSEELYKNFKENGISLSIYKYDDTTYSSYKNYLFHNRDLVLLDWKLDGNSGEEKSLSILSDIIKTQPQIHFCVIYTSESTDVVFDNLLSYFSGITKEDCDDIKIEYADLEEVINKVSSDLCDLKRYHLIRNKRKEILRRLYENVSIAELNDKVKNSPSFEYYDYVRLGIAFCNDVKSQFKELCPSDITAEKLTLCINNTIISVFNKDQTVADQIFDSFSSQIANYEKGVMHLLGLEMRNMQRKGSTFIDSAVLSVSKEALGYHKQQCGNDFSNFVKNIMVEHLKTNISNAELSILEAIQSRDFQDDSDKKKEYAAMNVFYNSQRSMEENKPLTFGDVFKYEDKYYICITALCDCSHPEKRDNCYYFAEGIELSSIDKALSKGESGYISYLSSSCCIAWDKKDPNGDYSHIVPVNYLVPDNHIKTNKLKIRRFRADMVEECEFEYITTIRQNYTQRIANYAFSHPVRVGIEFVKRT